MENDKWISIHIFQVQNDSFDHISTFCTFFAIRKCAAAICLQDKKYDWRQFPNHYTAYTTEVTNVLSPPSYYFITQIKLKSNRVKIISNMHSTTISTCSEKTNATTFTSDKYTGIHRKEPKCMPAYIHISFRKIKATLGFPDTSKCNAPFLPRTQTQTHTYMYTHIHFTALWTLYGITRVSWYQKGKTNLYFTEARDSEWQWH